MYLVISYRCEDEFLVELTLSHSLPKSFPEACVQFSYEHFLHDCTVAIVLYSTSVPYKYSHGSSLLPSPSSHAECMHIYYIHNYGIVVHVMMDGCLTWTFAEMVENSRERATLPWTPSWWYRLETRSRSGRRRSRLGRLSCRPARQSSHHLDRLERRPYHPARPSCPQVCQPALQR